MSGRFGTKSRFRASVVAVLSVVVTLTLGACSHHTAELAAIESGAASAPATGEAAPAQPGSSPGISGDPGVAASAATSPAPAYPPPIPPSSACPPSGINVVVWAPDAALGLRSVLLRAFNCASENRTLTGYAGLRVLNDAGKVLPVAIQRGMIAAGVSNPKPVAIFLKPGQSAMTVLSWRNRTTEATSITGAAVRIVAGPGLAPQDLTLNVDLGTTGRIAISAWARFKQA